MANKYQLSERGKAHRDNKNTRGLVIKGQKRYNLNAISQTQMAELYNEGKGTLVELAPAQKASVPTAKK